MFSRYLQITALAFGLAALTSTAAVAQDVQSSVLDPEKDAARGYQPPDEFARGYVPITYLPIWDQSLDPSLMGSAPMALMPVADVYRGYQPPAYMTVGDVYRGYPVPGMDAARGYIPPGMDIARG